MKVEKFSPKGWWEIFTTKGKLLWLYKGWTGRWAAENKQTIIDVIEQRTNVLPSTSFFSLSSMRGVSPLKAKEKNVCCRFGQRGQTHRMCEILHRPFGSKGGEIPEASYKFRPRCYGQCKIKTAYLIIWPRGESKTIDLSEEKSEHKPKRKQRRLHYSVREQR